MFITFNGLNQLKQDQLAGLVEVLRNQEEFENCPPVSVKIDTVESNRPLAHSQAEGLSQLIRRKTGLDVDFTWTGERCTFTLGKSPVVA